MATNEYCKGYIYCNIRINSCRYTYTRMICTIAFSAVTPCDSSSSLRHPPFSTHTIQSIGPEVGYGTSVLEHPCPPGCRSVRALPELESRSSLLDPSSAAYGSDELVEWNKVNLQPCKRCNACSVPRKCIIDNSHPACRTCRNARASCDRKPLFLFDNTKTEFYDNVQDFSAVYDKGPPMWLQVVMATEGRKKRRSMAKPNQNVAFTFFDGHPLPVCERCIKMQHHTRPNPVRQLYRPESVYTPEGIEGAPEFEEINVQLAAIDVAVRSVRTRLDELYDRTNGDELKSQIVREMLSKLRYLRESMDDPDLALPIQFNSEEIVS
ncbi:hypothetical protein B0H16DRAFT_1689201 [Mycena metata]|uniref:Uncharacterized protein n=1 Tax=Mycena metata TaxID=1033252 RepID=A0AAD7J7S6_9AGAR|nr:hypothetical protein B0H16DRAFT_1692860 [Mycena metata]KAJ7758611.1 hypothetical protein B0H16DRAFT_1689201 [Mycena metata]